MSASNSITFSQDGSTIAAGANKIIRLFQTAVPGKSCRTHRTHSKKDSGQPGATTFTAGLLAKTHCIRRRSCCAAVPVPCDTLLAVRPCERLAEVRCRYHFLPGIQPGKRGPVSCRRLFWSGCSVRWARPRPCCCYVWRSHHRNYTGGGCRPKVSAHSLMLLAGYFCDCPVLLHRCLVDDFFLAMLWPNAGHMVTRW